MIERVLRLVAVAPFLVAHFIVFGSMQRLVVNLAPRWHRPCVLAWARSLIFLLGLFFRLRVRVTPPVGLGPGRPFIVIANHQSPLDIAFAIACFGDRHPQFVARSGMDRGIPCLSYYLRNGGGLTLRRDGGNGPRLQALAARAAAAGSGVLIFPEGRKDHDRARYNQLAPFDFRGATRLLEGAADAAVIPLVIDGAAAFYRGVGLPRPGVTVRVTALAPVRRSQDHRAALRDAESRIRHHLGDTTPSPVAPPAIDEGARVEP